jgi:hypothetical protein
MSPVGGVNITSFLLTMCSFYRPVERIAVFAFSVAAISVFTLLIEISPITGERPFEKLLQTCADIAEQRKLPWARHTIRPYVPGQDLSTVFSYVGLLLALVGMWLFLWLKQGWRIMNGAIQAGNYSKSEWVVGVFNILTSITLAGLATDWLISIMTLRHAMKLASDGRTGDDSWGIGQIGAPFAWAPLLVDMGYTAVYGD